MNNLKELFEIQAGLDAEILKNHPVQEGEDRLEKKHAALFSEIGETLNEHRAFKFWSDDQKPRTEVMCRKCHGEGVLTDIVTFHEKTCDECQGAGECDYVLKELVDCLHFILSIGLELEERWKVDVRNRMYIPYKLEGMTVEGHFIELAVCDASFSTGRYTACMNRFIGLSEKLGYTWEQVREAYLIKNQENHYRQMNGY